MTVRLFETKLKEETKYARTRLQVRNEGDDQAGMMQMQVRTGREEAGTQKREGRDESRDSQTGLTDDVEEGRK